MIDSLTQTSRNGSMIGSKIKDWVNDRLSHTNIKDWVLIGSLTNHNKPGTPKKPVRAQ